MGKERREGGSKSASGGYNQGRGDDIWVVESRCERVAHREVGGKCVGPGPAGLGIWGRGLEVEDQVEEAYAESNYFCRFTCLRCAESTQIYRYLFLSG